MNNELALPDRAIPRIIHQCCPNKTRLREEYLINIEKIKNLNPMYDYRLYDDDDIADFLGAEIGSFVRDKFLGITKDYGAAKADFFRYFLILKVGGIYLDLKSTGTVPFDEALHSDDVYILSQWQNADPQHPFYGWGIYKELAAVPRGEYQQWHVIAAPGHPFLSAVTELMLERLASYTPWNTGYGHLGVIRTTGPITYTQAIEPIRMQHPHRLIEDESVIGLQYSVFEGKHDHRAERKHYGESFAPVIQMKGASATLSSMYLGMIKMGDQAIKQPLRRLVHRMRA